jgi:hypothetical protein
MHLLLRSCENTNAEFVNVKAGSRHRYQIPQACTNPDRQVARVTKFYTVASNISESSVWNLPHPSGAWNFEVDPTVFKNLCTTKLPVKQEYFGQFHSTIRDYRLAYYF